MSNVGRFVLGCGARVAMSGLALGAAVLGAGCSTADNDRGWIGSDELTGSVRPDVLQNTGRRESPMAGDAPSLSGMSRSNWGSTTFLVPIDGVAANWTYARHRSWTGTTARQRGVYPDAINAVELSGDTLWAQRSEALLSPWWGVWDFVLAVPRPFQGDPNQEEVWSLPRGYWRAPTGTLRRPDQGGPVPAAAVTAVPE